MKEFEGGRPAFGDKDQGYALLAVCWAFIVCAFVSTVLRVWVRVKLTRNIGWDDYNMMIAMSTTIIGGALITSEIFAGGLGRHEYYLQPGQRRNFVAIGWVDWIQTFITLMFTKISICLFLLRIVDSRKVRIAINTLIGSLILFTTIIVCLFLGICRPLKAYWDIGISDAKCLTSQQVENIVLAQGSMQASRIFQSMRLGSRANKQSSPIHHLRPHLRRLPNLLPPQPANQEIYQNRSVRSHGPRCNVRTLRNPTPSFPIPKTKAHTSLFRTATCCTVRTCLSGAVKSDDLTWDIVANVAWRLPEVNMGIFCANAPVLRPLYLFFRGRLATQQASSGKGGYGASSKNRILPQGAGWGGATKLPSDLDDATWKNPSQSDDTAVELGLTGVGKGGEEV